MPDFQFHEPTGDTYVSGWWVTSTDRRYHLRIDVPAGYPDECPDTFVTHPKPLLDYWGKPMTRYGTSHAMHTFKETRPGFLKACTINPEDWDSTFSLYQLLIKAGIWLVAYESHLKTGRPLDDFLLSS